MNPVPWVVVARREYLSRVRATSFLIGTIGGPLILLAAVALPVWLGPDSVETTPSVAVIDSAGVFLEDALMGRDASIRLWPVPLDVDRRVAAGLVEDGALDAVLVISPGGARAEVIAGTAMAPPAAAGMRTMLQSMVYEALIRRRVGELRLGEALAREMTRPPVWTMTTVTCPNPRQAAGVAIVVGMMLYATLLSYGLATMRAVVEEKASRVVELLLSSARAVDLLAGKIVGIAAVGITQYAAWGVFLGLLGSSWPFHGLTPMNAGLPQETGLAVACIAYFVFGYVLFAALYVVVGGMVSSLADAHHAHLPVTALLIAPVFLVWMVVASPESAAIRVISLVPVFAPVLMVARVAVGTASGGDVALSMVLLSATMLAGLHVAARVYRAGILMRGRPATPREVVRWIRE